MSDQATAATIDPTPRVEVREVKPRKEEDLTHVKKLIVAVHGVGNQNSFTDSRLLWCTVHGFDWGSRRNGRSRDSGERNV